MKCFVCGQTTKTTYRTRTPLFRRLNVYCETCKTRDVYVTTRIDEMTLKAALDLFYEVSMNEKDGRRNPYIRKKKRGVHFSKKLEPLLQNKETRSLNALLEANGVHDEIY